MKTEKGKATVLIFSLLLAAVFAASEVGAATVIGITVPQTGAYAKQGEEELNAYKLAIKEINNQGGLPGGPISYLVGNTQTNPQAAVKVAQDHISKGAVMITGGSSSSVAVALGEECNRRGVVFMAAVTSSNEPTGKNANRHTFRWYVNAHMFTKALAKTFVGRFGPNARYAYIYADYAWGQGVTELMRKTLEPQGATTVYTTATPLGSKAGLASSAMKNRLGYLMKLEEAAKANPDVLVCVQFGNDLTAILKQASSMGLKNKMAIVAPILDMNTAEDAGPEAISGVIGISPWYHAMSDRYEGSRDFVRMYESAYGKKPSSAAATAYVSLVAWADAVRRAGTTTPAKVVPALEDFRFTLLLGQEYYRKWDHQGIHPFLVVEGKRFQPGSQDCFNIIEEIDGEAVAPTRAENPVQMALFPGEQEAQASPVYPAGTGTGASAVSE